VLRSGMACEIVVVIFDDGGRRTSASGSRVSKGVNSFALFGPLFELSCSPEI